MSNMAINTNILALNSHRSLKGVGARQEKASNRLSSGYRINSAADDAAGLAISEKMRAQIRGLDMASKNSQDAISLIQTAEGGMQEVDNMLQRIRELLVQSSNDTNDQETGASKAQGDRQKIQDEINQLVDEIDSMAGRVEFNKKKLIGGAYDSNANTPIQTITSTTTGMSDADKLAAAERALEAEVAKITKPETADAETALPTSPAAWDTEAKAFLAALEGTDGDAVNTAYNALIAAGYDDSVTELNDLIDKVKPQLAAYDALKNPVPARPSDSVEGAKYDIVYAADVISANKTTIDAETAAAVTATTMTADQKAASDALTAALAGKDGAAIATAYKALLKEGYNDNGGAALKKLTDSLKTTVAAYDQAVEAKLIADATPAASTDLYFQVGANSDQKLELNIGSVNATKLGLKDAAGEKTIDVVQATGADVTQYIDNLDTALTYVTSERSKLGAAQNRLEYTIKSLDISSENLTASESRIRDTDMAKEMMNFTQANVLQQAATSMLAQANQSKQGILQLLQ